MNKYMHEQFLHQQQLEPFFGVLGQCYCCHAQNEQHCICERRKEECKSI